MRLRRGEAFGEQFIVFAYDCESECFALRGISILSTLIT